MSVRTRRLTVAALLAGGIVTAPLVAVPAMAADGGRPLSTMLTGEAEAPMPGDPDGEGSASLSVNVGKMQVCYELTVSGIAPAKAAHIHEAPVGVAGPVVVGLEAPTDGMSSGCVTVSREEARDIVKNPENYYVNVHNAEFPDGALRGQLGRVAVGRD
jgi:hypothetical protein